jgi:hypothetical protein
MIPGVGCRNIRKILHTNATARAPKEQSRLCGDAPEMMVNTLELFQRLMMGAGMKQSRNISSARKAAKRRSGSSGVSS